MSSMLVFRETLSTGCANADSVPALLSELATLPGAHAANLIGLHLKNHVQYG